MRTKWIVLAFALLAVLCLPLMSEAAKGGKGGKGGKNKGGDSAAVAAAPVQVQATVAKTDKGTVTVTMQLPTDPMTKVVIDGETKSLSDLKTGQSIKVIFSGSSVAEIDATSK